MAVKSPVYLTTTIPVRYLLTGLIALSLALTCPLACLAAGKSVVRDRLSAEDHVTVVIPSPITIDTYQTANTGRFKLTWDNSKPPLILMETPGQKRLTSFTTPTQAVIETKLVTPFNKNLWLPFNEAQPYHQPSNLLDKPSPALTALVKEITDENDNVYAITRKLHQWVSQNIATQTPDSNSLQPPQPVEATLNTHLGTPTEKNLLLTTMLRAVGIPAQLALGIKYQPLGNTGVGSFQPAVWSDVYLGEWIGFDANNPAKPLDATHIQSARINPPSIGALQQHMQQLVTQWQGVTVSPIQTSAPGGSVYTFQSDDGSGITPFPTINLQAIDIQRNNRQKIASFSVSTATDPQDFLRSPSGNTQLTLGIEALKQGHTFEARILFNQLADAEVTPLDHYYFGQTLISIGAYASACDNLVKASEENPELRGPIQQYLNRYLPESQQCTRVPPESAEDTLLNALHNQTLSNNERIQLLAEIHQQAPSFKEALYHLGELSLANGDTEGALQWFNALKTQAPNDPRSYKALASFYADRKQWRQAQSVIKTVPWGQLQGKPGTSQELITLNHLATGYGLLSQNPKSATGLTHLAEAFIAQGQLDEALNALNTIATPNSHQKALKLAVLQRQNRWSESGTLAKNLTPNTGSTLQQSMAHWALGNQAAYQHQWSSAIQQYRRALGVNSQNPDFYLSLAKVYEQQGQRNQQLAILSQGVRALKGPSERLRVQFQLALTQERSDRTAAVQTFQAIVAQQPDHFSALQRLGELALKANAPATAYSHLHRAYTINPTDANILASLGQWAETQQDLESSLDYYQRALKANPDHGFAQKQLTQLIATNNLPLKKPDITTPLNAASEQYLRGLLDREHTYLQTALATFKDIEAHNTHVEEISTDSALERGYTANMLQLLEDTVNQNLQYLQQQKPPSALQALHHSLMAVYTSRFEELEAIRRGFLGFMTTQRIVVIATNLAAVQTLAKQNLSAYQHHREAVFNTIPQSEHNLLFNEAGFAQGPTDYSALEAEAQQGIDQLMAKAVTGHNTKTTTNQSGDSTKPRAISDLNDLTDDERKKLNDYIERKGKFKNKNLE